MRNLFSRVVLSLLTIFVIAAAASAQPAQVFVTAPSTVQTYVGHDAKVIVSATTTVAGHIVTMSTTPLPTRAHLRQLTVGQTSTYEVSWTPIPGEFGTFVCFQGVDQLAGVQSLGQTCTTWSVGGAATIGLTGVLRTFQSSHPDMNRPLNEAAAPQQDFVHAVLGADAKPVQVNAAQGVTQFTQWFNDAPGINQSSVHSIYLSNANQVDPNLYSFYSGNWQPSDGQNFFTYEAHTAINYNPGQLLRFKAAGDMWVFINRMKVPGAMLYGVHNERTLVVNLDTLGLTPADSYPIDIFYAHRGATTIPSIQLELLPEIQEVPEPEVVDIPAGGFSAATTTLLGDAQISGGALRVLPSVGQTDAGAAWIVDDVQLTNGFILEFDYVGTGAVNAEGFAVTAAPTAAIGAGSSGLGYEGISRSLAVEFDARQTVALNDPPHQHISVHTAGLSPNSAHESASIGVEPPQISELVNGFFNATPQHVRVAYTPVTEQGFGWIRVWMNANLLPSFEALIAKVDIANLFGGNREPAAVGFTAGRGSNTSLTISSARLTTFPLRNTPPTYDLFGLSVHEGVAMQADIFIRDEQRDPITASMSGLPDGLTWSLLSSPFSLNDVVLRVTGTPAIGTGGFHSPAITVGDGIDTVTRPFPMRVNAAPYVTTPMLSLRISEDATSQVIQVDGHFGDVVNQPLEFSVESDQPWLTTWLIAYPDRVIVRPAANANGVATVTVRATDTDGESVAQTFTVIVDPVSDPPLLDQAFSPVITSEDAADVLVPIAGHFSDIDDAALTYSVVSNSPAVAAMIDGSHVRVHPAADQFGVATVTVRGSDASGQFVETAFAVTINPVNDPPTLNAIAAATVQSGASAAIALSGITPGPANESGQVLEVIAQSSDASATGPIGYAVGVLTLSPLSRTTTVTVSVTVTAREIADLSSAVSRTFAITILAVEPPLPPTDEIAGRMHGQVGFAALGNNYDLNFKVAERQVGVERGTLDIKIAAPKSGNKKASANRFESTAISSIVFSDDPAFKPGKGKHAPLVDTVVFTGPGTWNGAAGYRFEAKATDQGEPGPGRDRFAFTIYDAQNAVVATADMAIDSGNIQSNRLKK